MATDTTAAAANPAIAAADADDRRAALTTFHILNEAHYQLGGEDAITPLTEDLGGQLYPLVRQAAMAAARAYGVTITAGGLTMREVIVDRMTVAPGGPLTDAEIAAQMQEPGTGLGVCVGAEHGRCGDAGLPAAAAGG